MKLFNISIQHFPFSGKDKGKNQIYNGQKDNQKWLTLKIIVLKIKLKNLIFYSKNNCLNFTVEDIFTHYFGLVMQLLSLLPS